MAGYVATDDGRLRNRHHAIFVRGDDREFAADFAVLNDIIHAFSKAGKEVVSDDCCRGDRNRVVTAATIDGDRAVDFSRECCRVDAIA